MLSKRYNGWGLISLFLLLCILICGCTSQNPPETTTTVLTTVATSVPETTVGFKPEMPAIPPESDTNGNLIEDSLEAMMAEDPQSPFNVIVMLKGPVSPEDVGIFESHGGIVKYSYDKALYGIAGSIPGEKIIILKSDYSDRLHFISEDARMHVVEEKGEVSFRK